MANRRGRKRKGKNKGREVSTLMIFVVVFVAYMLLTLICTYLYNYLPLPNVGGIWGRDSFYESFVQGMYSSLADFFIFTLLLSCMMNRWERKNTLRKYHEEIEACRFWFEPQAAFRLRALILNLQKENVFEVDLTKCYMEKIKLKRIRLENSELMGAQINKSNLEHSEFLECNFRGAYLEDAILRSCKFDKCVL